MTLDESIDLIAACINGAASGEMWLPKLRSMRIIDLAKIFADRYQKPIEFIGMRPGEKLHEALVSEPESMRVAFDGKYYRMAPAHSTIRPDAKVFCHSSDQDLLEKDELSAYLEAIEIFKQDLVEFVGREIDEISPPFYPGEVQ
jgi:FlaA1/EpsC-like NDP-sugar epimerase